MIVVEIPQDNFAWLVVLLVLAIVTAFFALTAPDPPRRRGPGRWLY
jgi:hypothetical protein